MFGRFSELTAVRRLAITTASLTLAEPAADALITVDGPLSPVNFRWSAIAEATGYRLEIAKNAAFDDEPRRFDTPLTEFAVREWRTGTGTLRHRRP